MIYIDAFNRFAFNKWSNSQIGSDEIEDICYRKALVSFINEDEVSLKDRNDLQYHYMKNWFGESTNKLNSILAMHRNDLPTYNDFIKKVLINHCGIYTKPVERQIKDEKLLDLIDNSDFDDVMSKANFTAKMAGEMAVRPFQIDGELMFDTLTPENFRYESKFDKLTKFEYIVPVIQKNIYRHVAGSLQSDYYAEYERHVWTNETYTVYDGVGNVKKPTVPNKYGVIPFVILRLNDFNNYDFLNRSGGNWNLLIDQLRLNTLDFIMSENEIFGTIGMFILRNLADIEKNGTLDLGAGTYLRLDQFNLDAPPPDIEYLQAEHKFDILMEHKERFLKQKYKLYFLPSAVTGDTKEMSGKAMELDRIELNEIRNLDKLILKKFDYELCKMVAKVLTIDGVANIKEPEKYVIKYNDNQIIWDKKEQLEYLEALKQRNYVTDIDIMYELGFDGSDSELKERIKLNKEINDATRTSTNGDGSINERPAEESEGATNQTGTEGADSEIDTNGSGANGQSGQNATAINTNNR